MSDRTEFGSYVACPQNRRRFVGKFGGVLGLMLCARVDGGDAHMTAEERAKVLGWLEESRKEFLAAIHGVSEEQWKWKPAPDRWSVGEVAEHIVLAEGALFGTVQKALASPVDAAWEEETKGKTERIEAVMAPRQGKAQAPEALVPTKGMTPSQVREIFENQRVEILKFTSSTDLPLKQYTVKNPFFGPLNGYQWLMYAPLHTMRHDKQIAEVKGTAGYPK
ncbi:MAG TPA: DinB family protein [Bryobacteraceae bacterium]|nr:DinB family protein [Bryobacteraceae bacterium]